MRNPNRLYGFYRELQTLHMKYIPDWKFGQLISNCLGWIMVEKNIDIFLSCPEEEEMIKYIKEYLLSLGHNGTDLH